MRRTCTLPFRMNPVGVFTFVVLALIGGNAAAAPTFEDVLKYSPDQQAEYFGGSGQAFQTSCSQDIEGCINLLVSIAESNSSSSELAMYILNNALLLWTSSGHISASSIVLAEVRLDERLTELILDSGIDRKVRNFAITAHVMLFPPREELLRFFEIKIVGATDYREGFVLCPVSSSRTRQVV